MTEPSQPNARPAADAQAMLAAIVESSDDAIVSKTPQGIVTSWNHGAERVFGYPAAEMIGQSITTIIPKDRQHEETEILRRIGAGERVDHFETVRQRKDGTLIDVSVTISPMRDEAGRVIGASKIARDVTMQKQVQRELVAARDAAEGASKAKDHFLSVLSHELRTPLTPVLAAVSLIENEPSMSPQELRNQVGMIRRNIETEARLVDDLLDVTRIARGKIRLHFEVVDTHLVIRNVIDMLRTDIDEKGLSITLALRAKSPHVWADAGRLQQVFLNLLSNAVKFTPAEGNITAHTSNDDAGHVVASVSDTGAGIDADVLPRLFHAFEQGEQTVTRQFGGLGLGLSIVRSLVEMHHGGISASSAGRDKGATFTLTLDSVPPATATGAPSEHQQGHRGLRVLLVEDHTDTRQVLSRLLSNLGCQVWAVGTVREAIDLSDRESFDMLVSDIGLPDGTGLQVMNHLRVRQPTRGIALSGFGQDDDVRRSQEAGFEMHLTKPVNFQTLKEMILKTAG
jgi:PAS domain S-box-containing protein